MDTRGRGAERRHIVDVLRHTFASHLAQRGASPKAIQELLGHSEMATTMRYMHLAPAHHREAIALLQPSSADGARMRITG